MIDDSPKRLACRPVAGVARDLLGRRVPNRRPLPGPFQDLAPGRNRWLLRTSGGVRKLFEDEHTGALL